MVLDIGLKNQILDIGLKNPGLPKYESNVFFTFVNNSSTVRTKIGLRKVETKLSVSTTIKFLKNIALSNSTLFTSCGSCRVGKSYIFQKLFSCGKWQDCFNLPQPYFLSGL